MTEKYYFCTSFSGLWYKIIADINKKIQGMQPVLRNQ